MKILLEWNINATYMKINFIFYVVCHKFYSSIICVNNDLHIQNSSFNFWFHWVIFSHLLYLEVILCAVLCIFHFSLILVKQKKNRVREVAQSIKCLLYKLRDLSSRFQCHSKGQVEQCMPVISAIESQWQRGPGPYCQPA